MLIFQGVPNFGIHSGDVVMVVFDLSISLGKQVYSNKKQSHLETCLGCMICVPCVTVSLYCVPLVCSNRFKHLPTNATGSMLRTHTRCRPPPALWIKGCYIPIQHHSTC